MPSPTVPDDAALARAMSGAARAVFSLLPHFTSRNQTPQRVLEVPSTELASLREAMRFAPGPAEPCMCGGDMLLELEDELGQTIATLIVHHATTLHWEGPWEHTRVAFADADAFVEWLAARGVGFYAEQRERDQVLAARRRRDWERWLAGAPAPLRTLLEREHAMQQSLDSAEEADALIELLDDRFDTMLETLRRDRDSEEVARALLAWYGSGAGSWSSFAAYESDPEPLLATLETDVLLRAVDGHDVPDEVLLGLARYLASKVQHERRSDLRKVSTELRERMLARVRDQDVDDNLACLQRAFPPPERLVTNPRESGLVFVHPDRPLRKLAAFGGRVFAAERLGIVRFDPGRDTPVVLLEGEGLHRASLAIDECHVYVASEHDGRILRIPHDGGEPMVLAAGREQPGSLCLRDGWLGWLESLMVPDPEHGPPFSVPETRVCGIPAAGGAVQAYGSHEGFGSHPVLVGRGMAWLCWSQGGVVRVLEPGGPIEPLITDFDEDDDVRLASTGEQLVVAVASRSSPRSVTLRRHDQDGRLLEAIEHLEGSLAGLAAGEHGIALAVRRGTVVLVTLWDRRGRQASMEVPHPTGPLHVAADGVYFAEGPRVHRLVGT